MLIRVLLKNFLSYREVAEFNMLPNNKRKRHESQIYKTDDLGLLKCAAIYGNNAAGKTNLLKAIYLLKSLVLDKEALSNRKLYDEYVCRSANSTQ